MNRVKLENIIYAAILMAAIGFLSAVMLALSGCSSAPRIVKEETEITKNDTTVFVDVPVMQDSLFVLSVDSTRNVYEGVQLNGSDTTATFKFSPITKKISYKIKPPKVPVTYTKETNVKKAIQVAPEKKKEERSWVESFGGIALCVLAGMIILPLIKKLKWV